MNSLDKRCANNKPFAHPKLAYFAHQLNRNDVQENSYKPYAG
ncbi:MAG: hypothetical protein ABIP37_01130 [Methylotenera sp.]